MNIIQFYGHSGTNGVTWATTDICRHLVARGHGCTVVCRTDSSLRAVPDSVTYRYALGLHRPGLRRLLRRIIREHDIELINAHSQRDADVAIAVAREMGIPVLFSAHELSRKACDLAPRADGVIAVSVGVGNFLRDQYALPDQVRYAVPNGIDMSILPRDDRAMLRAELGFRPDEVWFGFIGRVVPNKNVHGLVSAFALAAQRSPRVQLIIIGAGSYEKQVRRMIDELGMQSRVRMHGWQPREQALRVTAALDVLALPSLAAEGLSNALLAAMALGVPVLASDIPSQIGGPIRHDATGWLVDISTPELLAEAILATEACGADTRAALGAAARQEIETHYRMERVIDQLETAFRETLARAGKTVPTP